MPNDKTPLVWHTEQRKIDDLVPFEQNPRKMTEDQVKQLTRSIEKFNLVELPAIDTDNVLVAGHQRMRIMQLLNRGSETIDVRVPNRKLTASEFKEYNVRSNKNTGMWDDELLAGLFSEQELRDIGFSELELGSLTFDLDNLNKEDNTPDVPEGEPETVVGDLYQLGRHRILCGDSTKKADLEKLMDGVLADCVFTDPPYNVDYSGKGKNTKEGILNDKMSDADFDTFLTEAFKRIAENIKPTAGCYVFHSHKTASDFERALTATGFDIDTQLIWNKPSAGMGMSAYRTKHEPFFYCSLGNPAFYGDRTGTTVWKVPEDDVKALKWFLKEQEALEKGESTVWSMSRANVAEYVHPTQKPAELAITAIAKSSKNGEVVLDTFLGSGTTLIAAEKTGRACYGMELDPKFVDVIVTRWCQYTKTSSITKNGKPYVWHNA